MAENTDIADRITDLKEHVTRSVDTLRDDVREMVTKGEFTAEIGRVDSNHDNLRAAHNKHVVDTADQFQKLASSIRWTLGFAVTLVGISVAIIKAAWP
jgi:hypothetical protein